MSETSETPPEDIDELRRWSERKWKARQEASAASGRPYISLLAHEAEWALWAQGGLLPENALPLTHGTKLRIKAWLNSYYETPRPDWPLWEAPPGVDPDDDEEAWVAEGAAIRDCIAEELGDRCDVYYDNHL